MNRQRTILIIDDDIDLCESVKKLLESREFKVLILHSSVLLEETLKNEPVDLVLLDIVLPDGNDGISLCKIIRSLISAPIIMLSGLEADVEKILSLELGADNYITKPFNSRVLLAHINAALRRHDNKESQKILGEEPKRALVDISYQIYEFQGFRLNVTARVLLSPDNQIIKLTSAEFFLLDALVRHPQCVLTREQLLNFININSGSLDRSIDILISRLRSKLEAGANHDIINTVRNSGYVLASCVNKQTMDSHSWQVILSSSLQAYPPLL